jgi:ribokinase
MILMNTEEKKYLVIVPGGLNVDIIGLGVDKIIGAGELTLGGKLKIGPGGKARNMAQMAAAFLGTGKVAMIGRTSKDPFGLWKVPLQSLSEAGVNTKHIKILSFEEAGRKFPGVALIPVDKEGKNQIYVLPGANEDLSKKDIDEAQVLFEGDGQKIMIMALEIPIKTAEYCIEKAASNGILVILDPGGVSGPINEILDERIFLLKPNEHEAQILTGVEIDDMETAREAAEVMLARGVANVLITCGDRGGYLFSSEYSLHIPCPDVQDSSIHDETGCGDQVTAMVASCLAEGRALVEAARLAIFAGTLQYYRAGIQPVNKKEMIQAIPKGEKNETE